MSLMIQDYGDSPKCQKVVRVLFSSNNDSSSLTESGRK